MRSLGLALLLAGCGGGPRVEVQDLVVSECLDAGPDDPPTERLILSGGEGTIHAEHLAWGVQCCLELELDARRDEETGEIRVTYEDAARNICDCDCWFDVTYTLVDVPAGTWVVRADWENVQVQVD